MALGGHDGGTKTKRHDGGSSQSHLCVSVTSWTHIAFGEKGMSCWSLWAVQVLERRSVLQHGNDCSK